MIRLKVTGWKVGLKKVSLTLLFRDEGGMGIAAASDAVKSILDGVPVTFEFPTSGAAADFARRAIELGAVVERDWDP